MDTGKKKNLAKDRLQIDNSGMIILLMNDYPETITIKIPAEQISIFSPATRFRHPFSQHPPFY